MSPLTGLGVRLIGRCYKHLAPPERCRLVKSNVELSRGRRLQVDLPRKLARTRYLLVTMLTLFSVPVNFLDGP